MAVVRYLITVALRRRVVLAPLATLLGADAALYSAPPNPVLATAAAVAAYTLPIQLWLALTFFNSLHDADRDVLAATVGRRRAAWLRLLAGGVLTAAAGAACVAYPVAAGRFAHPVSAAELASCAALATSTALAATALAALFAEPTVRHPGQAGLGLTLCTLLAVWLDLPPIAVARAAADSAGWRVALGIGWMSVFAAAAASICSVLWDRTA
jgi:hypothetical protein